MVDRRPDSHLSSKSSHLFLDSLWSFTFASSELYSSIFFDILDVDQSDLIDSFEYAITSQSCSSKDNTYLFESKRLSFFQNLFGQKLCSIRSTFFTSFVAEFTSSSSQDFVPILVYESDDGIVVCGVDMKSPCSYFDISLFLWSYLVFCCHILFSCHLFI